MDLTVRAGDVYGYLGPNGAGKTTSLRMMLGLISPTAGTIRLFGQDPTQSVHALAGVAGFVEAPTFYPYLTARRNLELMAAFDGGGAPDRVTDALATVELTGRADDRVGGYSHGMRQRLGIAAALLRDPKLLLLDEPATGLDPAGMRDMRLLIRRLADQGMTVLLSSHLMNEVEELCNRVAIVRSGRIVYEGEIVGAQARARAPPIGSRRPTTSGRWPCAAAQAGIADVNRDGGHITFSADENAVAPLSQALVESGALIRAMAPADGDPRGPVLLASPRVTQVPEPAAAATRRLRTTPVAALMPGVATVYRWELFKLRHQKRTYLGLGIAIIVPILFVVAVHLRRHHERGGGFAFSRLRRQERARDSPRRPPVRRDLAVPADRGARRRRHLRLRGPQRHAEDDPHALAGALAAVRRQDARGHHLRRRSRSSCAAPSPSSRAACSRGSIRCRACRARSSRRPRRSGSSTSACSLYLIPIAAIVCIGLLLSSVTRNSAAAVVGTLMVSLLFQLIGILPGLGGLQPYLLSTQFNAWQGLLRTPIDWSPIIQAVWVCAIYGGAAIGAAFLVFIRRDVAGG